MAQESKLPGDQLIANLPVPRRLVNALALGGVTTLGHMQEWTDSALLTLPNVGETSVRGLRRLIGDSGTGRFEGRIPKTKRQLENLIRSEATSRVGPWPHTMQVIVYPLDGCWRALIGYSEVSDLRYRDDVMTLIPALRHQYSIIE